MIIESMVLASASFLLGSLLFRLLIATTVPSTLLHPKFQKSVLITLLKASSYLFIIFFVFLRTFLMGDDVSTLYVIFLCILVLFGCAYIFFPVTSIIGVRMQLIPPKQQFLIAIKKNKGFFRLMSFTERITSVLLLASVFAYIFYAAVL